MPIRFASPALVAAVFALSLSLAGVGGCKSKGEVTASATTVPAAGHPMPGDNDCYKLKGATACAPNPSDPSGKNLPTPGQECKMVPCSVCGSATADAFRDSSGVAHPGWCICVPKSDDSGVHIYSCFTAAEWKHP